MLEFNLTGNTKLNDGIKIAFIIDSNRSDRKMRLPKLLRTVPQSEKKYGTQSKVCAAQKSEIDTSEHP